MMIEEAANLYEASSVLLLSSSFYLSRNHLKKNVARLRSTIFLVLPDQKKSLRLLQLTHTKDKTVLENRWKIKSSHHILRNSNSSELIRDVILVPDLSSFNHITSQNEIDPNADITSNLDETTLNIFVLTKSCIEQYSFHTDRPENCHLVQTISLEASIVSPTEIHIIDSLSYQQRLLLLLDSKGNLFRLSLWKKEVVIQKKGKLASATPNTTQTTEEGRTTNNDSNSLSITQKDKFHLSEDHRLLKLNIFPGHFFEKQIAAYLLQDNREHPNILAAHEIFPSRYSKSRPGVNEKKPKKLDGVAPSSNSMTKEIIATSHVVMQFQQIQQTSQKNHQIPSSTTSASHASLKDPLIASVTSLFPSKEGFSHVLPGMSLHDALHVPTAQEVHFLSSLTKHTAVKSTIEIPLSLKEQEDDSLRSMLQISATRKKEEIEVVSITSKQNTEDVSHLHSLMSLPQKLTSSIDDTITPSSTAPDSNSSEVIAYVYIHFRGTQDNDMITNKMEELTQNFKTTLLLKKDDSSKEEENHHRKDEVPSRRRYCLCYPQMDKEETTSLPHQKKVYDQFTSYALSELELLIAVASSETGGVGYIYYLDLKQSSKKNEETENNLKLFPATTFSSLTNETGFYGLQFISDTASLSEPSSSSFTSSSSRKKTLSTLLALTLKRSTKSGKSIDAKGSSSGHIISISTEREYDMELVSYSLSQEDLLTHNQQQASNTISTPNEKTTEQKTVTANETPQGGAVKLEDIFHAIVDMKQLFEMRFNQIERKLEVHDEVLETLKVSIDRIRENQEKNII